MFLTFLKGKLFNSFYIVMLEKLINENMLKNVEKYIQRTLVLYCKVWYNNNILESRLIQINFSGKGLLIKNYELKKPM